MKSLKLVFSREHPNHLLIQVKSRHGNFKSSGSIIFEDGGGMQYSVNCSRTYHRL